jgi:hypothetical protein
MQTWSWLISELKMLFTNKRVCGSIVLVERKKMLQDQKKSCTILPKATIQLYVMKLKKGGTLSWP